MFDSNSYCGISVKRIIGRYVYKLNYYTLIGVLSGATTNPPALAYSNDLTSCDAPAVGYATVYPLTIPCFYPCTPYSKFTSNINIGTLPDPARIIANAS